MREILKEEMFIIIIIILYFHLLFSIRDSSRAIQHLGKGILYFYTYIANATKSFKRMITNYL